MTKPNDGGPAFPGEKDVRFGQANDCNEGMSKRDWFAGQALAGWLASYGDDQVHPINAGTARMVADMSYAMADAMIAASEADHG